MGVLIMNRTTIANPTLPTPHQLVSNTTNRARATRLADILTSASRNTSVYNYSNNDSNTTTTTTNSNTAVNDDTRMANFTNVYNLTSLANSNYTTMYNFTSLVDSTNTTMYNFTSLVDLTNSSNNTGAEFLAFRSTTTAAATAVMTSLCENNGSAPLCPCEETSPAGNQTTGPEIDDGSLDALLYIVVVLLFYAFSIVVLMVKYIRRENKEAYLRQYFDDYVVRDHFQSAQARNQFYLQTLMDRHSNCDLGEYVRLDTSPAPVTVTATAGNKPGASGSLGGSSLSSSTAVHNGPPADAVVRTEADVVLFSIPETVCEVLEEEEEEGEFESAEDELTEDRSQTNTSMRTETEQISSVEELCSSPVW